MRRLACTVALSLAVLTALVASCTSFTGTNEEAASDGAADGGAEALLDGSVPDGAASDGGSLPFIRGFTKSSSLVLTRPTTAEKGDLLVFVGTERSGAPLEQTSFGGSAGLTRIGHCNNPNADQLYYGSRVDDGTPTYTLQGLGGGAVDQLLSVLVAVGNAGPPDDFVLGDQSYAKNSNGSADSVMIFHDRALVLIAFGTDSPVTYTQGEVDGGLSLVSVANGGVGVQLYAGMFPRGRTPTFGPFSNDQVCWGTVTVAIPPP